MRRFPPVNLSTRVDKYRGLLAEDLASSYAWLFSVSKRLTVRISSRSLFVLVYGMLRLL